MKEFVVEFSLPDDPHLFVRHKTNATGRNAKDAERKVKKGIPGAFNFTSHKGIVMLYGKMFCTVDELESYEERWKRCGELWPG